MIQKYFIVLTKTQEEPRKVEATSSSKVMILTEVHPTPDTIREVFRVNPLFSFAFLYKGVFLDIKNDSFDLAIKQLIRKYNCASFGLSERECKGNTDMRVQRVY
jgi:hypothetical protein